MNLICRKSYLIPGLRAAFSGDTISETWDPAAEVIIAEPQELTRPLLEQLPCLKLALCARAGYDAADLSYLKARRIALCNARGLYSVPIAEDIVCKILIYTTNTWLYHQQKTEHLYRAEPERSCLDSLTVGFIGTGSIACQAALRLNAFGCRVIGHKRSPCEKIEGFDSLYCGESGFQKVLEQSDVVVFAVNLTSETYHMLNERTICWMRAGAAVINIARGGVVDESALIAALRSGRLSYAGLDVFETEPLPTDSPLWDFPQVTLTPHASGLCRENHAKLEKLVKENLWNYQLKKPLLNRVF